MSIHTFDQPQRRPVAQADRADLPQPAPPASAGGVRAMLSNPANIAAAAATLQRTAGGQLARAGAQLLQLQRRYGNHYVQRVLARTRALPAPAELQPNRTGLPDQLKAGVEDLSGIRLDDVRVHYNSPKPAQVTAAAYAQGNEIHIAPGQEQHLPHEAWHVVQQKQGRVQPTMQIKSVSINDDAELEREADTRGRQAQTGGLVLQRKNLEQAGLLAGIPGLSLHKEPQRRKLASSGWPVHVYYNQSSQNPGSNQQVSRERTTKTAALAKAASMNAMVGKTVDAYAINNGLDWTGKQSDLDKQTSPTIDPFFFEAIVWYDPPGPDAIDEGLHSRLLALLFQHALQWSGYVEAIFDTELTERDQAGNRALHSMYDAYDNSKKNSQFLGRYSPDYQAAQNDPERNPKYSNVHDTKSEKLLADLLNAKEGQLGEVGLDAYTKFAGEGARWQCVRNHLSKLRDNSWFYTREPKTKQVWGVTFRTLWASWKSDFDKAYDIPDAKVRTTLLKPGTYLYSKAQPLSKLSEQDYDLDH